MARNERAPGDGAREGLRVSSGYDTHFTPDSPQENPQPDRTSALLTPLRVKYPVFREYRPLAIGIRAAVYAAVPSGAHKLIDGALALHCHSDAYLQAIAAGGPRYALDGAPSGEVCEEHRVAAVLVLARRKEKANDYILEAEATRRGS